MCSVEVMSISVFCRVSSLSQLSPESADVSFSHLLSFDGLNESVLQLKVKLEDFCKEEIKKISDRGKIPEKRWGGVVMYMCVSVAFVV